MIYKKPYFQIPIIIDDIKKYSDFEMTRCTYFTIESDMPSPNWHLNLRELSIPFYLLGLSGIICQPLENERFYSVEMIDNLFDLIEEHPSLYIDSNELWFPNYLFSDHQERGQVYRVVENLFNLGFDYYRSKITKDNFVKLCSESLEGMIYSEEETKAFRNWSKYHIQNAIQMYPKNPQFELKWTDDEQKKGGKK